MGFVEERSASGAIAQDADALGQSAGSGDRRRVQIEPLGEIVPGADACSATPGAAAHSALRRAVPDPGRPAILSLAGLRDRLAIWAQRNRICHLSPDLLPPRIWLRQRGAVPRVLVFVGGFAGQCTYGAPMASALGLPAHLFIPLDRIGLPGHATLAQLRCAARLPGIRLEVDLASECPASLWGRIDLLHRMAETLTFGAGRRPRYIWWGRRPVDARGGLMLRQSGYTAILCSEAPAARAARSVPLLVARIPPREQCGAALDCASSRS